MKWLALQPDHPILRPYRWARRIVITITGFTVLAVGVAMIVLPGPALVVIPAGLAILGLEFAWARRSLRTLKARAAMIIAAARSRLA